MIQKIKNKLAELDLDSVGFFLVYLGQFITIVGLCIYIAMTFGFFAGCVAFGTGLMTMGFLLAI